VDRQRHADRAQPAPDLHVDQAAERTLPLAVSIHRAVLCGGGVLHHHTFDIWLVGLFGFIGYLFNKLGAETAPLLLGFILGPMMEENLRRALQFSRGDWSVFVTRGLSASLLAVATLLLVVVLLPVIKRKREETFVEE
jgi:putative tricarboxylic transport membrane protein